MKKYFLDTNIFIRYFLEESSSLADKAEVYFKKAETKEIELVYIPEVILEIEYVLRKVYKVERLKIAKGLLDLLEYPSIIILDRLIITEALKIYMKTKIDLVDIILFLKSKSQNAEVLSFDKDFKKLEEMGVGGRE